jgi:hypothetical protein
MEIKEKRYYTLVEVALMIDRSYPMTQSLIKAFDIPRSKQTTKNGSGRVNVIDARDIEYLKNCAEVMTMCRKMDWVSNLPKYLVKELINRL